MPTVVCPTSEPRFKGLFPDWTEPRPVRFYLAESLLEARAESHFPTNGHGPDEDVNVYLFDLLKNLMTAAVDSRITAGAGALHHPPDSGISRRARADWYRVNGDHRLLYLGLFDRGNGLRRRAVPFGFTEDEIRRRDMIAGAACYGTAANLLASRPGAPAGLVSVMRKLERDFADYVHVLGVLAVRRWGMGAVLSDHELNGLLREAC